MQYLVAMAISIAREAKSGIAKAKRRQSRIFVGVCGEG
jgi:hypothetical protein